MIITKKSKKKKVVETYRWHVWFAWKPVRISDEEVHWLRKVARRRNNEESVVKYEYQDRDEFFKAKLKGEKWSEETYSEEKRRKMFESAKVASVHAGTGAFSSGYQNVMIGHTAGTATNPCGEISLDGNTI